MDERERLAAQPWDRLTELHSVRVLAELLNRWGCHLLVLDLQGRVRCEWPDAGCPRSEPGMLQRIESGTLQPGERAVVFSESRHSAPPRTLGWIVTRAVASDERSRDADQLMETVAGTVARELSQFIDQRAARMPAGDDARYREIIGRSPPMRALFRVLDKVVAADSTVLVQGENGTGKELIARAIHFNSFRAGQPFVVQNCSAFNDNLLDSELFGHRKGAFTGAICDKPGLFDIANGGTFFLDEVGDMTPALQVKLLRVLQEGVFLPVGGTRPRRVDVRIIAATNHELRKLLQRGRFREDLYYRLNVINIVPPPLRQRQSDIPPLIQHFLRKHAKGRTKRVTHKCAAQLRSYHWPGNVRELENEIERLVVLSGDDPVVGEDLLSTRIRASPRSRTSGRNCLPDAMMNLERNMIYEVLKRHHWNKTRAAEELRISRRNLIRKVQKYQIESRQA